MIDLRYIEKIVYHRSPSYCMDCGYMLLFDERSNRRCVPCYNRERKIKDEIVVPGHLLRKFFDR